MAVTFSENQGIPKLKPLQNVWKGGQDLESKVGSRRQEILSPFFFFFLSRGKRSLRGRVTGTGRGVPPLRSPVGLAALSSPEGVRAWFSARCKSLRRDCGSSRSVLARS